MRVKAVALQAMDVARRGCLSVGRETVVEPPDQGADALPGLALAVGEGYRACAFGLDPAQATSDDLELAGFRRSYAPSAACRINDAARGVVAGDGAVGQEAVHLAAAPPRDCPMFIRRITPCRAGVIACRAGALPLSDPTNL